MGVRLDSSLDSWMTEWSDRETPCSSLEETAVRNLLVASQTNGVGKTTTAINLAAAISHAGGRVLLIDADPVGGVGMALNLRAHADRKPLNTCGVDLPGSALFDVIPGLDILIPYGGDTCGDDQLERLLQLTACPTSRPRYCCRILNTPAFLGSNPSLLLRSCDELILVMRADQYSSRTLPAFLELVHRHNRDCKSIQFHGILLTLSDNEPEALECAKEMRGRFGRRILPHIIPYDKLIPDLSDTGFIVAGTHPETPAARHYQKLASTLDLQPHATTAKGEISFTDWLTEAARTVGDHTLTVPSTRLQSGVDTTPLKPAAKGSPAKNSTTAPRKARAPVVSKQSGGKATVPTRGAEADRVRETQRPAPKAPEKPRASVQPGKGDGPAGPVSPSNKEPARAVSKPAKQPPQPAPLTGVTGIVILLAAGLGFGVGFVKLSIVSMPVVIGITFALMVLFGSIHLTRTKDPAPPAAVKTVQPKKISRATPAPSSKSRDVHRTSRLSKFTRRPRIPGSS